VGDKMKNLEIYNGGLPVEEIFSKWYKLKLGGMLLTFTGIVRDDGGAEGLSFDIYEPMLENWFEKWSDKVLMAHSRGDVLVGETSFMCGVYSKHREFKLIEEFVEDFKANAPIWKYDIIGGKRVFAKDRSKKLPNSGILS
jgi:molybdopterin synthase catalytic subunit